MDMVMSKLETIGNTKIGSHTISQHSWLFMDVLGLMMGVTSLSTDVYLPAMPAMARDLQGNSELTVTGFLIGFAIAQLVWGVVSDKYGRKIPLLLGPVLFVIGSVGCAMSTSMTEMVAWRVFQAFGACVAPMLSRAMIRDLFDRTEAASMLSTLTMIMAVVPILGPLVGGQIMVISSWHGIFWFMVALGVLLMVSVVFLPETHAAEKRATGSLMNTYKNYWILLKNTSFMKYTLCVTFFYVAAYAFITGSPHVYIDLYNVDPTNYRYLFGLNIVGVMVVSAINRRMVKAFELETILKMATLVAMSAAIIAVALVWFDIGGMMTIVFGVLVFFSSNGIIRYHPVSSQP